MEHWIDDLARSMAGGVSRRAALRRIGAGIAGSLLGTYLGGSAWAQPQPVCQPGEIACGSRCCPPGQACCGGKCARLDTVNNCGACGIVCGPTATCRDSRCVANFPPDNGRFPGPDACLPGERLCPTGCANVRTDPFNCGSCGTVCSQGNENFEVLCVNGVCQRGPNCCTNNSNCGGATPFCCIGCGTTGTCAGICVAA